MRFRTKLLLIIATVLVILFFQVFWSVTVDFSTCCGGSDGLGGAKTTSVDDWNKDGQHVDGGYAICTIMLDDTPRLSEWIAYHYTTLPLKDLIIGLDSKISDAAEARMQTLTTEWQLATGINIELWKDEDYMDPAYQQKLNEFMPAIVNQKRQMYMASKCLPHLKHTYNQTWTSFLDVDEYIVPNVIHEDETGHVPVILNWQTNTTIQEHRQRTRPARQALTANFPKQTVKQIIDGLTEDRMINTRCIRLPALWYGGDESPQPLRGLSPASQQVPKADQLTTLRFRRHTQLREEYSHFSKAMIDLSACQDGWFHLGQVKTVHNPSLRACGYNGHLQSGTDYEAAIFRIHHYLGSLQSFVGRSNDGRGGRTVKDYWNKHEKASAYLETEEDDIVFWFDKFVDLVGPAKAGQLLRFTEEGTTPEEEKIAIAASAIKDMAQQRQRQIDHKTQGESRGLYKSEICRQ
eukprot:scaffold7995_cov173-Amphora_coffeaeformis.AAC.12